MLRREKSCVFNEISGVEILDLITYLENKN
jgi:hypothetical protein